MKKIIRRLFYKLPSSYALMFHHIDNVEIIKKSSCILDYEYFINIIDSGLNFVDLSTFLKFKKNQVLITFDDGLSDVYSVAYPELKKRNIPFIIFIVYDFIGKDGYLTQQQLLEMSNDPLVTVGSHGLSHNILKNLQFELQKKELIESKIKLEKLINKKINIFAYSHGQYDDKTIKILKESKCYDYVFGVAGFPINIITKKWKYYLPRINCDNKSKMFKINNKKIIININ